MRRKKDVTSRLSGKGSFAMFNALMILIVAGSIGFSVADKIYGIIPWSDGFADVIGVVVQVITAMVALIVSVVGIAISLQNEEFCGIKIKKLYSLRVKKHYSIVTIILISILLCSINLACYVMGLIMGAFGTTFVALLFLVRVVFTEVPIMAKDETAI